MNSRIALAGGELALLSAVPDVPYPVAMRPDSDDFALMESYCRGDLAAFEELYRRHKDSLYRYLLRLAADSHTAEDVFQDAWGKVVNARRQYRPTARFRTYLFHVAHNCFVDYLRRNRRHELAMGPDPDLQEDAGSDPVVETEHLLLRHRLDRALAELPREQRDAWLLYEEGGLGTDEIADVTGVNRETAKSRVRYATRKLRDMLGVPVDGGPPVTRETIDAELSKVSTP